MISQAVIFDLTDTADERFDRLIEMMLVALLAFMPLALGAVQPWSELVVVAVAALMSLALAAKLLARPDVRLVRTWAYVPILIFLALVLLQLVPLPVSLVKLISPQTITLRDELLASVPGDDSSRFVTISFYPEATLAHLRMLLAVVAVFVVTLNVVRRLEQVKRILAAVAIIGSVVALLALAQNLTDAHRIYWLIPIDSNQATSGPFVNHSHGAQFFNLALGAALGLMLMHMDQLPRHRRHDETSRAARAIARPLTWQIRLLACAVVAMAVCVPLSLSRGGMIALLAAAVLSTLVLVTRRGMGGRTWVFVGLVLAGAAVLLAFRFDAVLDRATTLGDPESLGGRVDILRGSRDAWRTFPVFGTGLGTFAVVFPMFDPSSIVKVAEHAENEYAQMLVETGALGVVTILAFLLIILAEYVRCVRGAPSPMASGAVGLGFGLVAILVHSAADFGQHVPAVASLTAVSCALLINLAQATRRGEAPVDDVRERVRRGPRAVGALVVLAIGGVTLFDAVQVYRAQAQHAAALKVERRLAQARWQGSDRDFAELIVPAQRAAALRLHDVTYRFDVNRYRWRALARRMDFDEQDAAQTRRVVEELLAGARIAPTYAPPYVLAGQLAHEVLRDARGEALLRTGLRLSPTNPDANIAVATLDARAGLVEDAFVRLHRTMALSPDHREEVIDVALDVLNQPDLALRLAGDDRALLMRLVRSLEQRDARADVAAEARARADRALLDESRRPDAPAATLAEAAQLALRNGDRATAIQLLRHATTIEYGAVDWRLDLARALAAEGQVNQAIDEARHVLHQAPAHTAAKKLLDEWERPATRPTGAATRQAASSAPATQARFKLD